MKTISWFTFLIFSVICINGQTINEIKKSSDYIWGVGESHNIRSADKDAMEDLTFKISMEVLNAFKNITSDKEEVKQIIETYESTIQQISKRLVNENPDKTEVIKYIPRDEINKVFNGRKKKIMEYMKLAETDESINKIGDALQYYYWTLILLRSHPENEDIKYVTDDGSVIVLLHEIPLRIKSILKNIDVSVNSIEDDNEKQIKSIYFNIDYKGKPVENYDYSYWNGKTWTNLITAKNGNAYAEFIGKEGMKQGLLRLKSEYIYENKSKIDLEIYNVIENTDIPYFSKAAEMEVTFMKVIPEDIKVEKEKPVEPTSAGATASTAGESKTGSSTMDTSFNKFPYKELVNKFIYAIETRKYEDIQDDLTDNGKDAFEHLIRYGKAKIINTQVDLKYLKFEKNVMVRAIPMIFTFESNDRQFIEDVTFTINADNKIDNISFSLSRIALDDIMSHSRWPEDNKLQLIQFMENYKTAYALERIDFIESIFSDDALIIIGRILEKAEPIDGMYGGFKKDVEYIRLSKAEYMERLRNVFNQNEFVNIHFEQNEVRKKNNSNEYGIQIVQNYYSTNYADKGYLFLYIDMRDTLHPRILVRSWQPEKNADGSVPGLSDFF